MIGAHRHAWPAFRERCSTQAADIGAGMGTTTSPANVFVNTGSSPANQLSRSTSLRKFKRDIKALVDVDVEFNRIVPVSYYSKASADDPNSP
jgi:hypothetical protein